MQQAPEMARPSASQRQRRQTLHSRAQEIQRMLEVGAFDTKIRQREAEVQALRQRKALLESELGRLRRSLAELDNA